METKDLEVQDDKFDEIQKQFEIDSRADSNNTYAQSVNELLSAVEHLLYSRQFNDGTKWQKHHDWWAEYHLKRLMQILPLNYSSNIKEFNP